MYGTPFFCETLDLMEWDEFLWLNMFREREHDEISFQSARSALKPLSETYTLLCMLTEVYCHSPCLYPPPPPMYAYTRVHTCPAASQSRALSEMQNSQIDRCETWITSDVRSVVDAWSLFPYLLWEQNGVNRCDLQAVFSFLFHTDVLSWCYNER